MSFTGQFTKIKDISDRRRLPRLGKIRLGFKIKKGSIEYPAELPFFLLPSDVAKIYGGKVTLERAKELGVTRQNVLQFIADNVWRLAEELEIMFPINESGAVFPQAYKWYGSSRGAKCIGNGEIAMRYSDNKKGMVEIPCPCENLKTDENPKGECTQRGHLMVLIPKVNMGGIYQIDLGSYHSIVDINSGIDYISALIGRFALVPLILRRIPMSTHHDGKKQIHFTLQVLLNVPIEQVEGLRKDNYRILTHSHYALPAPEDTNPVLDVEGEVIVEAPTEEQPQEQPETEESTKAPLTYEQRLEQAQTEEECGLVWSEILKDTELKKKSPENEARRKKLNEIKIRKKAWFKEQKQYPQQPESDIDLKVLKSALEEAPSVEELTAIWFEVEPYLLGEDKVKMMMIKDKRATFLKGKLI